MRRLALLACFIACADWRLPPTFPQRAASEPAVHEQALLGLSRTGDGAVADLVDADGEPPALTLFIWAAPPAAPRTVLQASPERARAVAARIRAGGSKPEPMLAAAIAMEWPEANAKAAALEFRPLPPAKADPGSGIVRVTGVAEAGALALRLRVVRGDEAAVLLLGDGIPGEEIELARQPLAGGAIEPQLWVEGTAAWLLAGSTLPRQPLRRAIGLRRASLRRGEARLHNQHGLDDYAAADVDSARREFQRAIAADPGYFDALYNAAAASALADKADEAVALLRRAAAVDPARVQVVGRNDDDLRSIRGRADVRALLGMRRLPPEGVPPPP